MTEPVLVTGAAGFIGMHACLALLRSGVDVLGIDRLGPAHIEGLERLRSDRLAEIERQAATLKARFEFRQIDIADPRRMASLSDARFDRIVHLAAQAGVRYSIDHPDVYVHTNLVGMAQMLELARARRSSHLVFASTSSVYGNSLETPFPERARTDRPVSFYAATKVANEAMAASYCHLFRIPTTGLRFFTVYGPWGRPDMAPWLFTDAILRDQPIKVFAEGILQRDFTYVEDIVEGIVRILARPPRDGADSLPYAVYNIGNNQPSTVNEFIATLERILGRKARRLELPMQPGDVPVTCADIEALREATGFSPVTSLHDGLSRFCEWFRDYKRL